MNRNLTDFCDEWVFLCGKSDRLRGLQIEVTGVCEVLCDALRRVLCAHGAQQGTAMRVYVEDGCLTATTCEGTMRLALPPVYGAGLPQKYDANAENEASVHVADCLSAIVQELADFAITKLESSSRLFGDIRPDQVEKS